MQEFKLVLSIAESSSFSTVLLDLLCFFLKITSESGTELSLPLELMESLEISRITLELLL